MNRIEKLLTGLLSEQDNVTHYNETMSQDPVGRMTLLREAQTRRNAIRAEIVEEYTELLDMLETHRKAFDAMPNDALGFGPEGWPYLDELKDRTDRLIAKAKGESDA